MGSNTTYLRVGFEVNTLDNTIFLLKLNWDGKKKVFVINRKWEIRFCLNIIMLYLYAYGSLSFYSL